MGLVDIISHLGTLSRQLGGVAYSWTRSTLAPRVVEATRRANPYLRALQTIEQMQEWRDSTQIQATEGSGFWIGPEVRS